MRSPILFKLGPFEIRRKTQGLQWFVDFLRMAAEEDEAQGSGMSLSNAYNSVAWVSIAIDAIAKNFARAPFVLMSGDTVVETGPVYELFRDVNPQLSSGQLWQATVSWIEARNEAFWFLDTRGGGFPKAIYVRDPARFDEVLNADRTAIVMWKYTDDYGRIIPVLPNEVVHFCWWSMSSGFRADNPWAPLKEELYQTHQGGKVTSTLLRNGGIPSGLLSLGEGATDEDAQRAIERWEKRHGGGQKMGRIAVIANGAKYERVSMTPQDMGDDVLKTWNRETILAKAGVPPAVLGISKDETSLSGKDSKEQFQAFWNLKLIPLGDFIRDKLRTDFFARYRIQLEGRFDTSAIPELQVDLDALHTRLRDDVRAGLLTINEAREMMTPPRDPVEWGDVAWLPTNLVPVENGELPEPQEPARDVTHPPPKALDASSVLLARPKIMLSVEYKAAHWRRLIRGWEPLEARYATRLRSLFQGIRIDVLRVLAAKVEEWTGNVRTLMEGAFWDAYANRARELSRQPLTSAMELAGENLAVLMEDLGRPAFDIYDTRAVMLLQKRLDRITRITETVRDQVRDDIKRGIEEGWKFDDIRDRIKQTMGAAENRASTIARTEMGGVINDSRVSGFDSEGFHYHQWGTALDDKVRPDHQIDGEVRRIGDPFSNGLMHPNDPNGAPEQVINCRCVTFPLTDEEAEAGGV